MPKVDTSPSYLSSLVVVVVRKLLKLGLIAFVCKKAATVRQKIGGAKQIAALNLLRFHWLINVLPLLLRFGFSPVSITDLKGVVFNSGSSRANALNAHFLRSILVSINESIE